LDVRIGNANGAVPRTLLSARDNTVTVNGNAYHIPLNVQSNTDSHIQLKTQNNDAKNVYLINRDGHFRVHHHGLGDRLEVNRDGNTVVNGRLYAGGRDILAELDALKANTIKVNDRIRINGDQGMLGACGWSPCGGMQAAVWTGDPGRAGMSIGRG